MTNSSTIIASLPAVEARTLRSGSTPNRKNEEPSLGKSATEGTDDSFIAAGEDSALAQAEEKLMLEDDEEIESQDEEGNPIVDTEKLENRMLTVAIVNSVVDSSGGKESPNSHRYGLRKRRRLSEKGEDAHVVPGGRSTRSNPSGSPRVSNGSRADSPSTTRSSAKETVTKHDASRTASSSSVAPLLKTETSVKVEAQAPNERLVCTSVPNPLANSTPTISEHTVPLTTMAVMQEAGNHQGDTSSSLNTLQAIPQGVDTTILPSTQAGGAQPTTALSSQPSQPGEGAPAPTPATNGRARRGRIFSIDIDPAGLDFPDLGIVGAINQQSELSKTAPLPPISATVPGGAPPPAAASATVPQDKAVGFTVTQQQKVQQTGEASNSDLFIVGRDRAMSFEFFSFGLNHDEPLPPAPEQKAPPTGRPRGDSIIFDPCSFRDGGVLEENVLLKSRGNSIDIALNEEVAIMNEPGFVPAPTTLPAPSDAVAPTTVVGTTPSASYLIPARKSSLGGQLPPPISSGQSLVKSASSVQMATLPSSLSGSNMSHHSTFQMELLNKDGRIGIYLPEARKERIAKFHSKRKMRIWRKRIKYDCRKKLADSRPRIKGRFVKRSDMDEED